MYTDTVRLCSVLCVFSTYRPHSKQQANRDPSGAACYCQRPHDDLVHTMKTSYHSHKLDKGRLLYTTKKMSSMLVHAEKTRENCHAPTLRDKLAQESKEQERRQVLLYITALRSTTHSSTSQIARLSYVCSVTT